MPFPSADQERTPYVTLSCTSKTGLNERIQFSKPDVGQSLIRQLPKLVTSVNYVENVNYKVNNI